MTVNITANLPDITASHCQVRATMIKTERLHLDKNNHHHSVQKRSMKLYIWPISDGLTIRSIWRNRSDRCHDIITNSIQINCNIQTPPLLISSRWMFPQWNSSVPYKSISNFNFRSAKQHIVDKILYYTVFQRSSESLMHKHHVHAY